VRCNIARSGDGVKNRAGNFRRWTGHAVEGGTVAVEETAKTVLVGAVPTFTIWMSRLLWVKVSLARNPAEP